MAWKNINIRNTVMETLDALNLQYVLSAENSAISTTLPSKAFGTMKIAIAVAENGLACGIKTERKVEEEYFLEVAKLVMLISSNEFLNIFIDLDHTVAAKSFALAIDSELNKETIHTAFLTLLRFIKYDEAFDLVFAGASAASAYEFCMYNHDKETT